ncbi:type VII secretion target [Kitasatospora sp. NPDC085879]|uniref:type VII secretion target n=1 Tax=Kitasatospora sp. NPDC085879 TaxID=3154769 RepID=UPI0034457583
MSPGFRVHPGELTAAGQAARQTAERLRADARAVLPPTDAAVAALPGWRTAAALRDCAEAWHRLFERLADDLGTIGADLVRTAEGYTAADESVRRSLTAAG